MTRKKLLTKEQVLEAINRWLVERGLPPTVEELRLALKVGSKRTVLRYLQWLEDEGEIERWPGARGLRLKKTVSRDIETRPIPLVGEATAGALMIAEENHQGWIHLPLQFLQRKNAKYFLLRVNGDSMNKAELNGARIENGDLVVVEQRMNALPGEIIVALIDGEATIKRLVKGDGYYILKPESSNKSHSPIILTENFQVQGVVTRVLKKGAFLLDEKNN
jgi:repressor LexA